MMQRALFPLTSANLTGYLLTLFIVTIFLPAAHAEQSVSTQYVNTKPVIRVGLPGFDMPPYSFISPSVTTNIKTKGTNVTSNEISGLLIDIIKQVADHAEFTVQIRIYPSYDEVLAAFQKGDLDLLPGVTSTFNRQQYMTFSEPIFSIRRGIITRNNPINRYQELRGKTIATEQGFALQELLPGFLPTAKLLTVSGSEDVLKAVKTGAADGYIGDTVVLSDLLQQTTTSGLELSILPDLPTNHLHFATPKGKHKLITRINFALEDLRENRLNAIYNQWLSPEQINMFTNYGHLKLSQEERNWLDRHPYISIGVHADWSPFDFLDSQQRHSGLSADLLKILSNELGIKFNIISERSYPKLRESFINGNIMMLSSVSETPTDSLQMYFSTPYTNEPWVLFGLADSSLSSLLSHQATRVGIITGSDGIDKLPELCTNCKAVSFINQARAFQALQKEDIDQVLTSLHHASPLLQSDYIGQFRMMGQIEEKNLLPLRFAVNYRHPILLNIINKALASIPPEEINRLEHKWLTFDYQEGLAPMEVAKWAALLITFGMIILIAIISWNRKMAQEIQQRKAAEKRAKRAEKRLQHLADNLDGIVLQHVQSDPDSPLEFHYTFISARVRELLNISAETLFHVPDTLLRQLQINDLTQLECTMKTACTLGHWEREVAISSTQDSTPKWIQLKSRITPREEGGYYWNTVITDISLLKQQQLALESARHKAEEATAAKSQFLATISHEVRTPISGILGLLELMAAQPLNDELLNLHGGLTQSARNMLHIVNDVLDFSKIEAGKLELDPTEVNLSQALAKIIQPQSIHAQQKSLAFSYWQDPALAKTHLVDDIRLHQILNNFLNNAIKFTQQGTVSLNVDVIEDEHNQEIESIQRVRFSVKDTGIGISEQQQQTLFQPFEQADQSTSRRFGGTGLGLAIAQKLVEQMHGEIGLSSEVGKGSTFSIVVPLPVVAETITTPTDPTIHKKRNALVVGYFIQREDLYHYLQYQGITVKLITQMPTEAIIDIIASQQPDYVFIALSIWQQLASSLNKPARNTASSTLIIINQNPMLSPEPRDNHWCLSVNPLLPDNLYHVMRYPISNVSSVSMAPILTTAMTESREAAEANNRLVLVAEDHPINQQVIAKQLTKLGIHADIVNNGQLAIEALATHKYGLLLSDCHMPEMDGYTLATTIRQQEIDIRHQAQSTNTQDLAKSLNQQFGPTLSQSYLWQHDVDSPLDEPVNGLPIIALTANAMQDEDNRCFKAGMSDFLIKPVSLSHLGQMISKWQTSVMKQTHDQVKANTSNEFGLLFGDITHDLSNNTDIQPDELSAISPSISTHIPTLSINKTTSNHQLDRDKIIAIFDDPLVADHLMEEFRDNHQHDLARLEQAFRKNDVTAVSDIAHRMKGAARMLECEWLAQPLALIEQDAINHQLDADSNALSTLRERSRILQQQDLLGE
ncbi:transporter substrate-binding domain-containing protein [Photobacterium nomapromontoriensis]|uniref:transporter substrate-binding domain-containing protein n=1 Tax=Photobacterium nomapromontoriensis TaxID=2910237 RepID=UPI003D09938F